MCSIERGTVIVLFKIESRLRFFFADSGYNSSVSRDTVSVASQARLDKKHQICDL